MEEAAGAWIARLEADDVDDADRRQFAAWLEENPRHAETFDAMRHTWHRLDALGIVSDRRDASDGRAAAPQPRTMTASLRLAVAATVLLLSGISTWLLLPEPTTLEYRTAVGHQLSVSLQDGSTIELNTDTLIEVDYTDGERKIVLLRGEAHFEVKEDVGRPFVVFAGNGAVRAVGTEFNVYLTEDSAVEVTVTEGIVEVSRSDGPAGRANQTENPLVPKAPARIGKGQVVRYGQASAVAPIPAPDVERRLAWRRGMLSFDGESLEEVVAQVSRYTDIEIIIVDADLRDLRVGGVIKSSDVTALVGLLETAFAVEVRREARRIYLSSPRKR